MDLNINKEFFIITIAIAVIVVIVVISTILYEISLPLRLSNSYTSVISILIVLLIGLSFMLIPDSNDKNKKMAITGIKIDNKFIVYLLLLIIITVLNFLT